MNDFEAWEKIIAEWKEVNRIKKLNQELYDLVSGCVIYLNEYSKRNNIDLPNKKEIDRMVEYAHIVMDKIDTPYQPIVNTNNDQPDSEQNHFVGTVSLMVEN